jgi:DNA mismatch repair protein MutS
MTNLTPAMRQYLEIKAQYRDAILFYRMGDFYEMFFEDAVTASRVLEITLTSRNKGKEDSVPLCGIPYHAASPYIAKLIEKGFKVAICEQMEDPRLAKGIVKRAVVRVITPGLVLDAENLSSKENNFLAALSVTENLAGLAFLDISTGEFRVSESVDPELILGEIVSRDFRELLVGPGFKKSRLMKAFSSQAPTCLIHELPDDYFALDPGMSLLREHFTESLLDAMRLGSHPAAASAAGAALRYVKETQQENLDHILGLQWHRPDQHLLFDETARRNLELFSTLRENKKEGSLLNVIDETVTPMGGRRLRWWLRYPLCDPDRIRDRLASVGEIKDRHLIRHSLRTSLKEVADLERLGSRISMAVATARDLTALKTSFQIVPAIREQIAGVQNHLLSAIFSGLDEMPDVVALIERAITEDPPLSLRDGGMIREGYDAELDALRSLGRDAKKGISALEERERKKTGISSLRVGFNSVFGYYIEVTRANAHLVPEDYVRKQTLVNAERYINQELKAYESTVLNAEQKSRELELTLFIAIRNAVAREIARILRSAGLLADLDAIASLAEIAERYGYCCPHVDGEDIIEIRDGRHPVVERMPLSEGFVPNDADLDCSGKRMLILTGPNMAGKSTYIRQVALIVLLAQMGSYVPAASARIGIVDRIFTRVGAADSLASGESTFMVEMKEVASILKNASNRSLILLDEVGRGTSTFDGLSIAWAVAEYIHDAEHLKARTLFATHYHQLTDLSLTKEGVKNLHIAVKEWGDRIIFLRRIMEGGTSRSYGIQVAGLAGVPSEVILRAREILENLERGELDDIGMPRIARRRKGDSAGRSEQLSLFMDDEGRILRELKNMDILKITPLDALALLHEWKERLKRQR